MSFFDLGYTGLFLASFLSATILPIASEGALLALLLAGFNPWACLLVASIGNILGGSTNYWIGRSGRPTWLTKLGVKQERIDSFQQKIEKYGFWMAALAPVPIIGDPLLVALGYFRSSWWKVLIVMSASKIIRYFAIISLWIA